MIYVALLRGINVGGNNKIEMKRLKATFERVGMRSVTTYINSGNIIFADSGHTHRELSLMLEEAIYADFDLRIKVLVRSLDEMREVAKMLPDSWTNDEQMKCDVLFLWDEIDDESTLQQLTIKPGIDTVIYAPGAILFSVAKSNATKSGLTKLIGTRLYQKITIRNANTFRKLCSLMEAADVE